MTADEVAFRRFHNALRILQNIDLAELSATLGRYVEPEEWWAFKDDPACWFVRADDPDARAVYRRVEARQPDRLASIPIDSGE